MSNHDYDIPLPPDPNEGKNVDYTEDQSVREIHAVIAREKVEPTDGMEPISLWLVSFCFLVLFWGGYYLGTRSGGFSPEVFDELAGSPMGRRGGDAVQVAVTEGPKVDDPIARGKRLYVQNCASCHQASGLGAPGVYPSLAGSTKVNGEGGRLVRIVLHGAAGPWQAHSGNYNGAMAAWGPVLTDRQIAQILTYVRQDFGNKGGEIHEDQVRMVRDATSDRKTTWTFEEIMAEPDELPTLDTPAEEPAAEPAPMDAVSVGGPNAEG